MQRIETEYLFEMDFELDIVNLGQTPYGQRIIGDVIGGSFQGPRLGGRILRSGADWGLICPDGTLRLDVRCCLQTDDGANIYGTWGGRWKIPPGLVARVADPESGYKVDPSEYYFRSNPLFETSSQKYEWLNDVVAIGIGRRTRGGVAYNVYEVK